MDYRSIPRALAVHRAWTDNERMAEEESKAGIGHYLARARKQANYTQPQVAPLLGYESKSGLSALERGANEPTAEVLCKMADLYGCTLDYLLGREDKARPDFQGITREHTDFLRELAQLPQDVQDQIIGLVHSLSEPLRGMKMVQDLLSIDPRGERHDITVERLVRAQEAYRQVRRK